MSQFLLSALTLAGLALGSPASRAQEAAPTDPVQSDYEAHLRALFEHFHAHPELSFQEHATAARLAAELEEAGCEVTTGVGGTGVVALLRNGEGPTVLLRADMDGLPVKESTGLDYASTATGIGTGGEEVPVMHACGHDVHMTALVGTARQLVRTRDAWSGTVMLIGQPAEERLGGARAMLAYGLYARFGVPDHALAFHVSAGDPAGKISLASGLVYSSSDSVDLTVRGVGAHGASPHKGIDPIYVAARIVVALQGLVSRELSPLEPGVVTVGSIHGGYKHNIIPDEVRLELTVRADSEATRAKLLKGIERVAEGVARSAGVPDHLLPVVELSKESTPATENDPALVERLRAAFVRELGPGALFEDVRDGMGAEDFAYFVRTPEGVPGAYFRVGGTSEDDLLHESLGGPAVPSHHSPYFEVEPEPSVTAGVRAMTVAVHELLGVQ